MSNQTTHNTTSTHWARAVLIDLGFTLDRTPFGVLASRDSFRVMVKNDADLITLAELEAA